MIQTVRCLNCGRAIDAFIDLAAGIPPGMSRTAIDNKVQSARIRHAEQCPALLADVPHQRRSGALRRLGRRSRRAL